MEFKTQNRQKAHKTQKHEKLVFQNNRSKNAATRIEKNNDNPRIMLKVQLRGSFKVQISVKSVQNIDINFRPGKKKLQKIKQLCT